ncbi:MAG: PKD domain-containing protein [Myxococcota bacterium]|nr:PKD domain-containing protein [Myxococcota bacterium]
MRLRVSDGATPPATGEENVTVTVTDVDPVSDPGGPYVVAQGVALTLDGRGSIPGSPADPISTYSWEFNDGSGACADDDQQRQNCSPVAGADLTQPVHIFAEHGTYNVELTVTDEDSSTTQTVRVEVRDVDPVIGGLDEPEQAHEISYMTYTMNATPGAPGDPILRYEWDINPAGAADAPEPEYAGREASTIRHQYHDAGEYNMRITVRDGDSASRVDRRVTVVEVTLKQLLEHVKVRIDEVVAAAIADGDLDPVLPLAGVDTYLTRSIWGEAHDYRGNTLLAMEGILQRTAEAQSNGVRFGLSHWAMSRQLVREMSRHRASIVEGGVDAADPSIVKADEYIADMRAIYDAADFKNAAFGQNGGQLAQQVLAKAVEAYYWLSDSVDQCNTNDRFDISGIPQAQLFENMQRLEDTNTAMIGAFGNMRDEWTNYRNAAGSADDPGPGADQASTCMATLSDDILPNASKPVTFPCEGDQDCVTDREALDMELNAMSLIDEITELEAQGVWVRNWKTCMTMGLRFRIELSLLRVEFLCGANTPFVREARQVQQVGLDMVDEGRFGAALQYYATNDRRCLMMDIYNQCIVPQTTVPADPADPDGEQVNPTPIDLPEYCAPPEEDDAQADDAQGGGG